MSFWIWNNKKKILDKSNYTHYSFSWYWKRNIDPKKKRNNHMAKHWIESIIDFSQHFFNLNLISLYLKTSNYFKTILNCISLFLNGIEKKLFFANIGKFLTSNYNRRGELRVTVLILFKKLKHVCNICFPFLTLLN